MKILDILKKTEEELREAIAEAARAGDYRTIELGRNVAVNIKELYERVSGDGQAPSKPVMEKARITTKTRRKKTSKRSKPAGLPRFEVRNGSLYKIGWSKKQRSEYSHKVPRAGYDAIVDAMAMLAKEGTGPFAAEAVIEKLNACTEETVPAYQVYVVLAALRALGVISQVGREGYEIPTDILEKAGGVWRELARR